MQMVSGALGSLGFRVGGPLHIIVTTSWPFITAFEDGHDLLFDALRLMNVLAVYALQGQVAAQRRARIVPARQGAGLGKDFLYSTTWRITGLCKQGFKDLNWGYKQV